MRFQSILLPVTEAETAVASFRRDGDWSSAHGIPPHITIAGPWPLDLPIPDQALAELAASIQGVQFALDSVGILGDAVCLFPEDDGELLRWRARILVVVGIADAVNESWRLHLTVRRGMPHEDIEATEVALGRALPIACEARGLLLARLLGDSEVAIRQL